MKIIIQQKQAKLTGKIKKNALSAKKILKNTQDIIGYIKSRLCGNSVCSECSKNKFKNNKRICDICQFKLTHQDYQQMKNDYLKMLEQQNKYLVEQTDSLKNELQKMRDQTEKIKSEKKEKIEKIRDEIQQSENNLKSLQNYVQYKETQIEQKHEGLQKYQDFIKDYQNKKKTLEGDIELLEIGYKMQLQTKELNQNKKETLIKLLKRAKKIEDDSASMDNEKIMIEVEKILSEIKFLENNQYLIKIKDFF